MVVNTPVTTLARFSFSRFDDAPTLEQREMKPSTEQQSTSEREQEQKPVATDNAEPPKPPASRVPAPLAIVGLTADRVRELLSK